MFYFCSIFFKPLKIKAATRLKINVVIDVLMFLAIIVVSAIGLLLKYVLIHGADRWLKYGDNVELTYLGLDRHQWGYIHWISSLVLIGLVVLHLVFHWRQIVCLVRRYLPSKKVRYASVSALLLVSLIIAVSPFLLSVEVGEAIRGYRNEAIHGDRKEGERLNRNEEMRQNRDDEVRGEFPKGRRDEIREHSERLGDLDIQGSQTISEVAAKYDVSSVRLKEMLGIPGTASNSERLGRLRRTYGFSMSDVESCVLKLQEEK